MLPSIKDVSEADDIEIPFECGNLPSTSSAIRSGMGSNRDHGLKKLNSIFRNGSRPLRSRPSLFLASG